MQNPSRLCLALILAACTPETTAVAETAGSTTSPGGETDDGNSSPTTDEGPTTLMDSGTESEEPSDEDGFVPHLDGPPGESCDPFAQNCPDGEKCVPYGSTGGSWDANKCVPILGDGQAGEACTYDGTVEATDTCDASSHCWEVQEIEGQWVGSCTSFCKGTPDDPICAEGTSCLIANEGSINLCIATCHPLAQDCPEGLTCSWANNGFNCIFSSQDGQLGDPCVGISDCVTGLWCLSADVLPECAALACCGQLCSLAEPACDWEGTECVSFFDAEFAEGYEDVGVCIVPEP